MGLTDHTSHSTPKKLTPTVLVATILWIVAIGACLGAMSAYRWTPSATGAIPTSWIKNSIIEPDQEHGTLLMFAHPRCPCTQASLTEFQKLVAQSEPGVKAVIVFYSPTDSAAEWRTSANWVTARNLKGVSIVEDPDGQLAQTFSAKTSGMTYLFQPDGTLQYAGGITAGRGHEGENAGQTALQTLLGAAKSQGTEKPVPVTCSVYGCSLSTNDYPSSEDNVP